MIHRNTVPLRIAFLAAGTFLVAGVLQGDTGGPTPPHSSAKTVEIFYTWLEQSEPSKDSTALIAFRDPDSDGRPTLVWLLPLRRAGEDGSFTKVNKFLEKALFSQFVESTRQSSVNTFRDAIRRNESREGLLKGYQYRISVAHVQERPDEKPIVAADYSLLPAWNELVGPDKSTPTGLSQSPTILDVVTNSYGSVWLAATADLLLLKPSPGSLRDDKDKLAARLETSALDLLAAMAKKNNSAPSVIDLRSKDGDSAALCAEIVNELSAALSRPLVSVDVRRSPARLSILEKAPSRLGVHFAQTPSHWALENSGLEEAQVNEVVVEGPVPHASVVRTSVAGCSKKALLLLVKQGGRKKTPDLSDFSLTTYHSAGGWSLRISPPPRLTVEAPKVVSAGQEIRVEFRRVDRGKDILRFTSWLLENALLWLMVAGCTLLGIVAGILFLISRERSTRQGNECRFKPEQIRDTEGVIVTLLHGKEHWWWKLKGKLRLLERWQLERNRRHTVLLTKVLNRITLRPERIFAAGDFPAGGELGAGIVLREETRRLLSDPGIVGEALPRLNYMLLEDLLGKFLVADQSSVAEPIQTVEAPAESRGEDAGDPVAGSEAQATSQVAVEPLPDVGQLQEQLDSVRTELGKANRELRESEVRYTHKAAESVRLDREKKELKKKFAAREVESRERAAKIKRQSIALKDKEKKLGEAERESKRLLKTAEKQKNEIMELQRGRKEDSDQLKVWQAAFRSVDSPPQEIAQRLDRETRWLSTVTDSLKAFLQVVGSKEATAALEDHSSESLGKSLDTLGAEVRRGRTLVEEMLRDLAGEQDADNLAQRLPEMGTAELRVAYDKLRQQRAAIDRIRKLNPRIANVIWVIKGMRQLADPLARMAEHPAARLLNGTLLEPAPLAMALQRAAEKSEERWNEMLRTVTGPERGSAITVSQAFKRFLDWFLDGERFKTLTNLLRLAQVIQVYCADAEDPEIQEFYNRSHGYCEECLELQKRFEWIGVRLAQISFFKPPQTGDGWLFHENGDSHPLIFESYALKKLAVGKALDSSEEVTRTVGDVSTWGFHCDGYKELRSDTRGWLCRGWRTL